MTNIVIGNLGEVGGALQKVLNCVGHDKDNPFAGHFDIIHVALPYTGNFMDIVRGYQKRYTPKLTVIHSTVPVGSSRKLGAIHSPIHGIHPDLEDGIRTFVKYIGATNREDAETLLRIYQERGIKGYIVKNPETSELSKLGCTTRHGLMIIEQKLFKNLCNAYGANFEQAYTQWNGHYTEGYRILGLPYVQRPILKDMPGPIGGHCILPNCELLGGEVANFILKQNQKL